MTNNPAAHIRISVFGCQTQAEFADLLGTTQASVSRWESDGSIPRSRMEAIRELATARGAEWSDSWFFEIPNCDEQVRS